MRKIHLLPIIAAALLAIFSNTLSAQPNCERGKGDERAYSNRLFAELNLTTEQKEQLKTLHNEMQTIRQKHFEEVKAVRKKIKTELLKSESSQNTLYGYAGELGELEKQMSREHGDHLLKVKKILTPEQFSKLVEKEDRMSGKGFHRGGKGKFRHNKGMNPDKGEVQQPQEN